MLENSSVGALSEQPLVAKELISMYSRLANKRDEILIVMGFQF